MFDFGARAHSAGRALPTGLYRSGVTARQHQAIGAMHRGVALLALALAAGSAQAQVPARAAEPSPAQADAPRDPLGQSRDAIVSLERAGTVLGLGSVLAGDGRILTALSPLTHGNDLDARFADGSVSRVRVGHSDRAWDLALLVPQNGRWQKGLRASTRSAANAGLSLRVFSHLGPQSLALSRTVLKGTTTLVGADSELLPDALELASSVKPTDLGGPVLDDQGNVLAVIGRACARGMDAACKPTAFGIPVSAVKAFLRTVPENALPPAPWLGIRGVADEVGPVKGVRVLSVHPESAAAAAGLRGDPNRERSDVVVAVDGVPVPTPEVLADTINEKAVGDSAELLLFGGGRFRQVSLSLRPAPGSTSAKGSKEPVRGPGRGEKPR